MVRQYHLNVIIRDLLALLGDYGASELTQAMQEALDRDVPHPNAVRQALERRREQRQEPPPMAIPLNNPKAQIFVRPGNLSSYDQLSDVSHTCAISRRRCKMTHHQSETRDLEQRAKALNLHGLLAHWDELAPQELTRIADWLGWEETERHRRGLDSRLRKAKIGRFKTMAEFDWDWPKRIDKATLCELMSLAFIKHATNIILVGTNGLGKSTVARNLTHQAALQGHSALFISAAQMLADLAAQDGDRALRRRIKHYARPTLLAIDEVGYLSYGNRHADLLFEIINQRYEQKPTIITTNRPFSEWGEVFPNAACVVSLVDRLVHHSEIIVIEGESYRMKEAKDRISSKKAKSTSVGNKINKASTDSKGE
jgi:DNA replication protein DnaC